MDKRVIFAVAGAGKTATIINKLSLFEKSLIITYTENNYINLKQRVIEKFGFLPSNIKIYTYFSFLYSFCYKPFLDRRIKAKGINYSKLLPLYSQRIKDSELLYYMDRSRYLYHNRLSKLFVKENITISINNRLEKYFDNLFIDEIQDFGGHDFNFLKFITKANVNITFVGDFFQHTFDTSSDGNTNKNIYNDYEKYLKLFENMGLFVDTETLKKSYRCSPKICDFVMTKSLINIESHRIDETIIKYVEEEEEVKRIFFDNNIIKLFYQNSLKYNCYSINWGKSKGQDHYHDICVVLNATTLKSYNNNSLYELAPSTKNKFYVACTRSKGNLYFIDEKKFKFL